ncbi:hypothetical protein [Caballeronia grimmiae]|uniref:hypothetical protein n=1 Tax=Caballeronia grimmiae TaxID=1071679 RepID=UPI001E3C8A70|nr:hypothetical protein [Caballeronia grimmiae]
MSASCARRSRIPLCILGGLVANGATAQDAPIAGKATLGMTAAETRLIAICCRASKMDSR